MPQSSLDDTEIRRLYVDERLSTSDIAILLGVRSKSTIQRHLEKMGVPRRTTSTEWKTVTDAELRDLYENQGLSTKEIANRFGVSEPGCRQKIRAAGIAIRPPGIRGRKPVPDGEIVRLYQAGMTLDQVAEKVGLDRTTVHRRLVVAGVPRRRPKNSRGPVYREDITPDVVQQMYVDEGMTLQAIAIKLDTTAATVKNRLNQAGVKTRQWRDYRVGKIDGEEIVRLYTRERVSIDEIAARLNISTHSAYAHLEATGAAVDGRRRARTTD